MRVLIADDSMLLRKGVSRLLGDEHFPRRHTETGTPTFAGVPPLGVTLRADAGFGGLRPSDQKAGARTAIPLFMRDRAMRGEQMVSRFACAARCAAVRKQIGPSDEDACPQPAFLENPHSARAELVAGQHVLNQRGEQGFVHLREPYQTRVETLELTFRHRIEVDAANTLLGTGTLQPTNKDLSSTGIGDRALTQSHIRSRRQKAARSYGGLSGPFGGRSVRGS